MAHSPRSSELNHDDPSSFSPPAAFGPFRVLHQIGSGVLGPVFRTYEPERDRLIAVKAFRIDLLPEQSAELRAELQSIVDAGLTHPGIVQTIAAGMEGHLPYLAQEYVAAESLDIAMKHYAPAAPARILPFLRSLAGAIDAAAAEGVFHGALHPRDVFVTTDEARATGFGIVQAIENIGFRAPTRRPYTAPERVEGGDWGPAADVFSLGAIAHELLTARRPAGPGDQDGSFAADVPAERRARIRDVLASALAEDPAARFTSATAFVDALEAASDGERAEIPAAPAASKAARSAKSAKAARAAAGAAGAAAALSLFDPEDDRPAKTTADAEEPDDEPVETVDDVEDTSDVDTADVHDATDVEPGEPEQEPEPEPEPGTEPGEPVEPVEPPDTWPPQGFATDDLDIVAERETDEALADFDLDLNRIEPAPGSAAAAAGADLPSEGDRSALDYEVGAEEDENAFRETEGTEPVVPAAAASAAGAATAARMGARPEPWRPPAVVPPGPPAGDRLRPVLWVVGGLAVGFLLAWMLFGRGGAPDALVDQPAAAGQTGQTPADQTGQTPAGPAQVTEQPIAPPVSAPPTPATAATPPPPTRGSVLVRSTPSNAMVVINGVWTGRTPLTKRDLPLGTHTVRVVLDGYVPVNLPVTLSAGNPSREVTFDLTRRRAPEAAARGETAAPPAGTPAPSATATLAISSRPAGARVTVDGRFVGTTPLKLAGVSPGSHEIRIELEGYRPWTRTIRATANEDVRVAAPLEPGR